MKVHSVFVKGGRSAVLIVGTMCTFLKSQLEYADYSMYKGTGLIGTLHDAHREKRLRDRKESCLC
jgi:hypothetical protein